MKLILALLLGLSTPAFSQWRAIQVSSPTDTQAIQENFRRASLWSNRKLDRFSNDTLYGQPIFKNGIKFNDGTIQTTAIVSTLSYIPVVGGVMTGGLTMSNAPITINGSSFTINGGSITFVNPGAVTGPNYVQFNTAYTDGFAEGRLQWNVEDGTLEVGMPGGSVNLQIGQEHMIRCYNDTGSTIPNGSVVYITSATASRPTIALADADGPGSQSRVFGVATEDITGTGNKTGYVTTFGLVRGLNTSAWTEGESLYLGTTPGQLTNVIPQYPAIPAYVATALHRHATEGIIGVRPMRTLAQVVTSSVTSSEYWGDISSTTGRNVDTKTLHNYHKDPTGFPYPSLAITSLALSGRVFTINGSSFPVYINGARVVMSTSQATIPDTTQTSWLYYDTEVSTYPSVSASFPGFDKCLIASVYYSTRMVSGLVGDERHGSEVPWRDHEYKHETIGSRYASGMSGSFAAGVSTITAGEFYDEDLEHMIPQMSSYTALYKNGSSFFDFAVSTTANYQQLGQLYYNSGNALTALSVGSYAAYWVFATPFTQYPYVIVVGNRADTTLAAARENNTLASLSLTGFPTPELKPIYRVIYRQGSGSYTYQENADYRSVSELPGANYVPTQHSSLSGLSLTEAAHPYDQTGGFASYDWVASTLNAKPDYDEVIPSTATGTYPLSISGSAGLNVLKTGDTMTGQLSVSNIVSATRFDISGSSVISTAGGPGSTFIGLNTGNLSTGIGNTFVGQQSGAANTTGALNVFVGGGATNTTGFYNTYLGASSGNTATGSNNVFVGKHAGYQNTGSNNTMIGSGAGDANTSGSGNILIGKDIDTPAATTANYLNIGGLLIGDLATSSATIVGNLYANNYYGNGSNLAGIGVSVYPATATIQANYGISASTIITSSYGSFGGPITASSVTATGAAYVGGNLGLGIFPDIKLDVLKADNGTDPIATFMANNGTIGTALTYGGITSTGTNASNDISIWGKGSGNVYIGGTSAGAGIRVRYADASNMIYFGAASPTITADSGKVISIGQVSAATGGLNVETTNNRVGIGNSSPGYKLDVSGDINTTGAFKINGVAVAGLGDVVLASTQTFSGANTFQSSTTFNGSVTITSSATLPNSTHGIFPDYSVTTSTRIVNTVYQAEANGWLAVVLKGQFINGMQVMVGPTSSPSTVVCQFGNDYNNNTWSTSCIVPMAKGTYYKFDNYDSSYSGGGYDTIDVKWFPVKY